MTKTEMMEQIEGYIAAIEAEMVADLAALVAVDSVKGPAAPGAPYGTGPRGALDAALAAARRMGLAVNDGGGHVGWAEVPGREKGVLATITHMDIVPAGEGWTGDAFTLREQEGWLMGRGVQDDKGPSVLCLYAARFFAEKKMPLRYTLRVLLGCDEETGMGDVEHYLAAEGEPLFCFSPDSEFPVCNGEKGVFEGEFTSGALGDGDILEWTAGAASNVIPERAACLVQAPAGGLPAAEGITCTQEGDAVRIEARGKGGHAAYPEGTRNAIGMLVAYLLANGVGNAAERDFLALLGKLHGATDGSGLGIAFDDGKFDPLTCIGGLITLREGHLTQNINIRYPTNTTGEGLTAALSAMAAQHGTSFEALSDAAPFYIEADSPAIKTLMDTWNEVSGRQDAPYTMGGGTYARHFKHAVSFGPGVEDEKRPAFAGQEHMPDEAISLETLRQALKVYILAIGRLQDVDLA